MKKKFLGDLGTSREAEEVVKKSRMDPKSAVR